MNGAGISPKVMYKTRSGKYVESELSNVSYDSSRYFYEAEFTLPADADSVRGIADVKFVINNNDGGKGYIANIRVYEEGKYISLLKNDGFANGFKDWCGDGTATPYSGKNYTLSNYDSSVFVFYYDDEMFDDGDWAGVGTKTEEEQKPEEKKEETKPEDVVEDTDDTDDEEDDTQLLTTGSIRGKVVDGKNEPIEGLSVVLGEDEQTTETESDGRFYFYDVEPGTYNIYFLDPNGSKVLAKEDVVVEAGYQTRISTFRFSEAKKSSADETSIGNVNYGIVCGYLYDADGKALEGQKLYLGTIARKMTKKKGTFQFNNVPAGKYDLYTTLSDGSICILKRVTVKAGKGQILKIRMPGEGSGIVLPIAISGGAVVILGGATAAFLILKKKKILFG